MEEFVKIFKVCDILKILMKTSVHLIISLIIAAILYPFFGIKSAATIFGGVLIDVDHYLWYVYKYRKTGLMDAYRFYARNIEVNDYTNVKGILLIFHTIEFLVICVVLSFYFRMALLFTVGLISHYIFDFIFLMAVTKGFIVNHSVFYWLCKRNH